MIDDRFSYTPFFTTLTDMTILGNTEREPASCATAFVPASWYGTASGSSKIR